MDTDTEHLHKTVVHREVSGQRRPKSVFIRADPWFNDYFGWFNCGI
jgi:hypothetical protein